METLLHEAANWIPRGNEPFESYCMWSEALEETVTKVARETTGKRNAGYLRRGFRELVCLLIDEYLQMKHPAHSFHYRVDLETHWEIVEYHPPMGIFLPWSNGREVPYRDTKYQQTKFAPTVCCCLQKLNVAGHSLDGKVAAIITSYVIGKNEVADPKPTNKRQRIAG